MSTLVDSFIKHRGLRGAHFYDEKEIQFYTWNEVEDTANYLNFTDDIVDKVMELVANYNAQNEFIAIRLNKTGVTIEVFQANELRK